MPKRKPLKVCFFSKYPPIEGGVSSKAYWLARALGRKGIEMHVVTSAPTVEEAYRQTGAVESSAEYQPLNVFVHGLSQAEPPFHIPFSPAYLERLITLGLKVVKEHDCDLIDSSYFQPFGMAAAFTKLLTGKPCILRHAGSDITRLFSNEEFRGLYKKALNLADMVVTKRKTGETLKRQGVLKSQLWFRPFQGADPDFFNPEIKPADLVALGIPPERLKGPVLTYLGKYDPHKGLKEIVEAASTIEKDFLLLFITGGRKLPEFREHLENFPSLKNKHYFLKFLPPWQIPSVMKASTCLFHLENDFPVKIHMSAQPIEAFGVGTPVLMSYEVFRKYQDIPFNLEKDGNVLAVDPKNKADLTNILLEIIDNPVKLKEIGQRGHEEIFDKNQFDEAAADQIRLYRKVLKNRFWRKVFRPCERILQRESKVKYSLPPKRFQSRQAKHPCLR